MWLHTCHRVRTCSSPRPAFPGVTRSIMTSSLPTCQHYSILSIIYRHGHRTSWIFDASPEWSPSSSRSSHSHVLLRDNDYSQHVHFSRQKLSNSSLQYLDLSRIIYTRTTKCKSVVCSCSINGNSHHMSMHDQK